MRKFIVFFLLSALVVSAAAKLTSAPLIALREARQGYENIVWAEQRTKIGGDSVNGYIQGLGGADDALVGYIFENDWDMLVATVGFKDTAPEGREVEFSVEAGGKVLYKSGVIESKGESHQIRVPIRGHRQIMLRIASDRYNGTAGAAWGEPTVLDGLSDDQMKSDWSLSLNKKTTLLPGNSAPREISLPLDVPGEDGEIEYRVRIRRDGEERLIIVETEREDS